MDSQVNRCISFILMWFKCGWFSALFCSDAGTIIPLSFMAIKSMITFSSLTSMAVALSALQLLFMASHVKHILTAFLHAHHLGLSASFLLLSCSLASVYDSTAFMVTHTPGISSSLLVSWWCLYRYSAMNSCGPDLYRILMLWMCSNILCNLCHRLAISFLKIDTVVCALLSFWLHGWSSNGKIFLGHGVCPGLLFLCS